MQAKIIIKKDDLTPAIRAMAARVQDARPAMEAAGHALVSVTKRSFTDAALRPSPWAPTKQPNPPLRRNPPVLWQSIRISGLSERSVTVGTDRPYAIYHQFGTRGPYTIRPRVKRALKWIGGAHPVGAVTHPGLPARPFFPFDSSGKLTPPAQARVFAALENGLRLLLNVHRE